MAADHARCKTYDSHDELIKSIDGFVQRAIRRAAEFFEPHLQANALVASAFWKRSRFLLIEFGAFVELTMWEKHGVLSHLPEFPVTVSEARILLGACIRRRGIENDGSNAYPLLSLLVVTWLIHCVWCADRIYHAEVVLGQLDDNLADTIAEFVWQHRNTLAAHLNIGDVP